VKAGYSSIRRDLVTMIMLIAVLSIILTAILLSVLGYVNLREHIASDLKQVSNQLVANNMPVADYSHLPSLRRKTFASLSGLVENESISLLCIFSPDSQLILFFDRELIPLLLQATSDSVSDEQFIQLLEEKTSVYLSKCNDLLKISHMGSHALLVDRSIPVYARAVKGKIDEEEASGFSGRLLLEGDAAQVTLYLKNQLITTLLMIVGVMVVSYLLAIRLQRNISRPILRLSDAAQHVSIYKDYSIRVPEDGRRYSTEITQLMASFNSMLSDIEDRDGKLMRKNVELERAKEAAESANISKTQFLANISHELRTPLNAIIGFSSIITSQLFGPLGNRKYVDYGQDIHDSGVHLLEIINDILDLSKAEAGKLSLKLERFDVRAAIEKCKSILAERAHDGDISVFLQFPAKMPEMVADRVRFIQIMLNLMSNAVKFTEPGGRVDVTVEVELAASNVSYFTINVRDTGVGMRREDIDTAFKAFGQVDGGLNRKYEGTGLGLPLTKKLVELHNASIRIESELKRGTSVTVRFISDPSLLD